MASTTASSSGLKEHEVAHHFDDLEQEFESHKTGMWLFLASEIMMFGGLFVGLIIFMTRWPEAYREGSLHLDWKLGAVNTFFLLTSGLTMALAAYHAQQSNQGKVRANLLVSLVLAFGFLVVKTIEYQAKFSHGTLPGKFFSGEGFTDPHSHLFFGLYFVMTGLHAVHVLVGIGLMIWCLLISTKEKFTRKWFTPIEMAGLYWALVDLVWIFLFPALYLVR
jgi:cytochrome c oxidase subunit III